MTDSTPNGFSSDSIHQRGNEPKAHSSHMAEYRMQLIMDNLPMVCGLHDRDFQLVDCNNAAVSFFGVKDKKEYLDRYVEFAFALQPNGGRVTLQDPKLLEAAMETGQLRFEWMFQKSDGAAIPAEVTIIPIKWEDEDALLSIIQDMTDRDKYRESERLSQQRLQALLDSSPIACMVVNDHGQTLEINQKLLELFGVDSKQEYLDNISILSPEYQPDGRHSSDKWHAKLMQAFETGSAHFEWMHRDLNGADIPCELSLVRIEQQDHKLVLGYLRDLRELKSAIAMKEHLQELAFTDSLTGVYNRRYFMQTAERELEQSIRNGQSLSLLMVDLDHFKHINDEYGHPTGDEVLRILMKRVKKVLRADTVIARYGGEEFIIMLKDASTEDAINTAWRIQKTVERSKFLIDERELAVTVSIGIASCAAPGKSLTDVIEDADAALYKAKNSGRNTVAWS